MDPRLVTYYNRELQYIREMGGEFAREFPKIAGRLGLDGFECADPYVERLLEGFSFLAARIQLKIDAEFPRFTQHLLESVYPDYLAPLPSMTVVQLQPDLSEGSLAAGFNVPRDTRLRANLGPDDQTACEYRTAHDLSLWPLKISEAEYLGTRGALAGYNVADNRKASAGLRLRLETTAGLTMEEIDLDSLNIFLRGSGQSPTRIYEQAVGNCLSVVARPGMAAPEWQVELGHPATRPVGFAEDEALLPNGPRTFSGYRLLREYFTFPSRFLFFEINGLAPAVKRCVGSALDIFCLFDRSDRELENAIGAGDFALHCTPAINLFAKRADRIHLDQRSNEYHVVPDRTCPMDFEVYRVQRVTGHGSGDQQRQEFKPFYSVDNYSIKTEDTAFFATHREPRLLSSRQRLEGARSTYVGSEVEIALVDSNHAPFNPGLRQLALETLCTNRDLPLSMPLGIGTTDFFLDSGAPVESVRCIAGPTRPRPPAPSGELTWRLINHLNLNYLSLIDTDEFQGAAAIRELLSLYGDPNDSVQRKKIEGVISIASQPVVRRMPSPGPITFGRGLEIKVNMDEAAFEGSGVFLLGSVLEQFFARYVALNSFTETVLETAERGEIMRWKPRLGRQQIL